MRHSDVNAVSDVDARLAKAKGIKWGLFNCIDFVNGVYWILWYVSCLLYTVYEIVCCENMRMFTKLIFFSIMFLSCFR